MRFTGRHLLTLGVAFGVAACTPADDEYVDTDADIAEETAEVRPPYADWDLDTDGRLTGDEFREWARERDIFGDWDDDDNDTIGEDEFAAGMLGIWDDDDDDMLSPQEWQDNVGDWFDEDHSTFESWDGNGDGSLTREELRQGFIDTDWFGDWDLNDDDQLDQNEFGDGFFGLFDEDRSGDLDENEWTARDRWTM